ncbi:MAG: N-acetyltransferase, partial [Muriicola sp.]|nr:N-acetyltransferase [Muriicola sp.]
NGDRIVGYALCMHPDFKDEIPVLFSMFKIIEEQSGIESFIVMGQICVAEDYRGKGVFRGLYLKMKEETSSFCDSIITEVDGRNTRSLEAHLAVGFRVIKKYQSDGRDWYFIVL